MSKEKKALIKQVSYANYAFFLSRIESHLFSPLLQKALNFYVWFYTTQKPCQIFTSQEVRNILAQMKQEKPRGINSLAAFVGRLYITDGIALREAIRWRLNHLGGRTDMMLLAPNDAVRAVRDCLTCFADAIEQSEDKNGDADSTTKEQ
jgi:hypothetical protein